MSDAIANFFYRKASIRVNKKWDLIKGQVTQESIVKNRKLFYIFRPHGYRSHFFSLITHSQSTIPRCNQ